MSISTKRPQETDAGYHARVNEHIEDLEQECDNLLAASKHLIEILNDISPDQFKRGYHNPRKIALEAAIAAATN